MVFQSSCQGLVQPRTQIREKPEGEVEFQLKVRMNDCVSNWIIRKDLKRALISGGEKKNLRTKTNSNSYALYLLSS